MTTENKPHKPHSSVLSVQSVPSDRFKFRVWKPDWKQYDNDNYLSQNGVLVYAEVDGDGYSGLFCDGDDGVIEQCTGFRDKTGELIYEGDVVLLDTGREKLVHAVKWFQGKFVLINEKGDVDGLVWSGDNRSVIGNIHEREANK